MSIRVRLHLRNIVLMLSLFAGAIGAGNAHAISLDLDSIAAWGRFPRFCINTYRWGDKFFNSQNPDYVVGTGKKFSIKANANVLTDLYNFIFSDGDRTRMMMMSDPTTTVGLHLNYMALSVGYDLNIGKFFGGGESRKQFNFQFNCSLFSVDYYYMTNNIGSTITRVGPTGNSEKVDVGFNGINNKYWGIDTYYFFNHKNYSQAAAFSFGKVQVKSSGSLYAGFSVSRYWYEFDFNKLPDDIRAQVPLEADDYFYQAVNRNYGLRIGYAYNWVFRPGWLLAVSESPIIGIRSGWVMDPKEDKTTFSLSNRMKASLVYNRDNWFVGAVTKLEQGLIYNKKHTLVSAMFRFDVTLGYRFNLWK